MDTKTIDTSKERCEKVVRELRWMPWEKTPRKDALKEEAADLILALRAELDMANERTVTLCGSTRFKAAYIDWFQRLTDQGLIVLTVGRYLPKEDHGSALKVDLDKLHFRKIDRSSRILVLDVGGYIGDSTRNEIAHAESTGKKVEYLSKICPEYVEPPLSETDIGRVIASEYIEALNVARAERDEAVEVVRFWMNLVSESHGIAGFHLNGDIAKWDEFEDEIETANAILSKHGASSNG